MCVETLKESILRIVCVVTLGVVNSIEVKWLVHLNFSPLPFTAADGATLSPPYPHTDTTISS